MKSSHQIAVRLDSDAFEILKRLAAADNASYATVISHALAAWENSTSAPLAVTSTPLAPPSGEFIVYATLDRTARLEWKAKVQALRAQGESYDAISKILFTRYGLTGWDGLPLGSSTMRGMAAI